MKIEELNKTQIVLLTLLVSFVTSIATGIVTVSLVDQAPPSVTQTINRVVERTVEKITPAGQGASVVTKETTVVVKDEDLITKSIEQNSASLVDINRISFISDSGSRSESFTGIGLVLSSDGLVAADFSAAALNSKYSIGAGGTKTLEAEVVKRDLQNGLVLLKILPGELKDGPKLSPVSLGDSSKLKLGQTVIALGGRQRKTVAIGIISSLITSGAQDGGKGEALSAIETNLDLSKMPLGSPLLDLFGGVIGLNTGAISQASRVLPVEFLKQLVADFAAGDGKDGKK